MSKSMISTTIRLDFKIGQKIASIITLGLVNDNLTQERKAFLFCKEDRAILCRECDISIHRANEHTKHHNRFLLAGVKLSDSSSFYDNSSDQALCSSNSNGSREADSRINSVVSQTNNSTSVNDYCNGVSHGEGASIEARSMSEYLIETLPGWHGEEFVDPSASNYGFFYEVCNPKTVHKLCIESFEDSKMGFVIW